MNARANEIITREEAAVPMVSSATSILQVIERAASDPAVDIDKMERLMAMHERIVARDAEAAWNDAMAACQKEVRQVAPDAYNPQTKSRYASYSALDAVLRPVYTKHGFAISYDSDASPVEECIRVIAIVMRGGFSRTYKIDMPRDGKGAKGGDVMTKTHATGAGMQYGMRYMLKAIFNIAIGDLDNDGNAAAETGMSQQALADWVKKIEASTTKPDAKKVWQTAHKAAAELKDLAAAATLKQALMDHAAFIDGAAK